MVRLKAGILFEGPAAGESVRVHDEHIALATGVIELLDSGDQMAGSTIVGNQPSTGSSVQQGAGDVPNTRVFQQALLLVHPRHRDSGASAVDQRLVRTFNQGE